MNRLINIKSVFVSLLIMTISACGGGGGGGGGTPPPVNLAPVAIAQSVSTDQNTDIDIVISGTDVDGDSLTYSVVTTTQNGALTGAAPNLTYAPDEDFTGSDSFTFTVNDGFLTSSEATVSITVNTTVVQDTTPDAFTFSDKPEVAPNQVITSDAILITGINTATPITVSNGEYSINGGGFTALDGLINNNQSVVVRLTSSSVALETLESTLTIGGVTDSFSITTSDDITAPTASIAFPSEASLTTSDSITISGNTVDDGTIDNVTVNGVSATTTDGFVNWQASVPLQSGANELTVVATDLGGNTNTAIPSVSVESRPIFLDITQMDFHNSNNRIVFFDDIQRGFFDFDPITSGYNLISDRSTPDAVNTINSIRDFEIDQAANTAIALVNSNNDSLLEVDLDTGSRTIITADNVSVAAHTLEQPNHIQIDAVKNVAYVLDSSPSGLGRDAIIQFDLITGEATVISDNTFPSQGFSSFVWPDSIVLDEDNNRILMADTFSSDRILAIDIDTGARSKLAVSGSGVYLPAPKGITIDTKNSRALVHDGGIVAIELDTGTVSRLTEQSAIPANIFGVLDMVYDGSGDNNRLFVVAGSSTVYTINLDTGIEEVFSDSTTPNANNPLGSAEGLTLDLPNNRLLVADSVVDALIAINLTTAERTIISNNIIPDATNPFVKATDVGVLTNNQAYVIDQGSLTLLRVDITSGARTVLSDNSVIDTENTFNRLESIALDVAQDRTIVVDSGRKSILSVDNSTGARAVISDLVTPDAVNSLQNPAGMVIDGGVGYVSDPNNDLILKVDLTTGQRTILSSNHVPDNLNRFQGVRELVVDSANSRLLVIDNNGVMGVSLVDGARTVLSSNQIPNALHPFSSPVDISLDVLNQRAFVLDQGLQAVLDVDLNSGARTPYLGGYPNAEPALHLPNSVAFDETNNNIIVAIGNGDPDFDGLMKVNAADGSRERMTSGPFPVASDVVVDQLSNTTYLINSQNFYEVDIDSGVLTIISGNNVPNNDSPFSYIVGLALDKASNKAYVADRTLRTIFSVDLTTGIRTILSSNTIPDDLNPFNTIDALVYDNENSRLLVLNPSIDEITAIDIATGARTIFSNNTIPDNESTFSRPVDMVLDKPNSRLLVLDAARRSITAVDLGTGARTHLRSFQSGITNLLETPMELSLTDVANQVIVSDLDVGLVLVDLITGEHVIISK